jgi:hypothetical protein
MNNVFGNPAIYQKTKAKIISERMGHDDADEAVSLFDGYGDDTGDGRNVGRTG